MTSQILINAFFTQEVNIVSYELFEGLLRRRHSSKEPCKYFVGYSVVFSCDERMVHMLRFAPVVPLVRLEPMVHVPLLCGCIQELDKQF